MSTDTPKPFRRWTEDDIATLSKMYARSDNNIIALLLNRTRKSLVGMAMRLGLKKEIFPSRIAICDKRWTRPIGSTYVNKHDGYTMLKTGHNKWELKQRVVWREHYGEDAPGNIIFLDGDKTNFEVYNLEVVTPAEQLKRNGIGRFPRELQEVIMMKARITRMVNKRSKQQNGE